MILVRRKRACDCSTQLGAAPRPTELNAHAAERELRRLRRKGWSETKIERWKKDKDAAVERRRRDAYAHMEAGEDVTTWLRRLSELATWGPVGVWITDTDALDAAARPSEWKTYALASVDAQTLGQLDTGPLHLFHDAA